MWLYLRQILQLLTANTKTLKAIQASQELQLVAITDLAGLEAQNAATLAKILAAVTPPPQVPTSVFGTITIFNSKGELDMAAKATAGQLLMNDDGTGIYVLEITDEDGVPIPSATDPTSWAAPVFASTDMTPGPSAFTLTPNASNLSCAIAPVQPPVLPLAQNVGFSATIVSGPPTAPIIDNAGGATVSLQADASKPTGVSGTITITS